MAHISQWLFVVGIGWMGVAVPGPNLFMTIRNSAVYGRRAGLWTALGLGTANLISVGACLAGISLFLTEAPVLFEGVRWAGAVFLIYIGLRSVRARKKEGLDAGASGRPEEGMSRARAYRLGLSTCLLNPKVMVFFLAFFTQIVDAGTPLAARLFYGATIAAVEWAWMSLVAGFLSSPPVRRRYFGVSHWIERAMGGLLIALGTILFAGG